MTDGTSPPTRETTAMHVLVLAVTWNLVMSLLFAWDGDDPVASLIFSSLGMIAAGTYQAIGQLRDGTLPARSDRPRRPERS